MLLQCFFSTKEKHRRGKRSAEETRSKQHMDFVQKKRERKQKGITLNEANLGNGYRSKEKKRKN
jgi:hypothetical protein